MRDDIHNKVPLSAAFRALIKRCAMPAYQQETAALEPYAHKAIKKLIADGCSTALINRLAEQAATPSLFGMSDVSFQATSSLQLDLMSALSGSQHSVERALASATKNQIDGMCREAMASLRAAGASREEAMGVDTAMKASLFSAVDKVTAQVINGTSQCAPIPSLTGATTLPLGPAAQLPC